MPQAEVNKDGKCPLPPSGIHYIRADIDIGQADKLRTQQELERLQIKHIGTGHTDYPGWEWKTNIYRDTYSNLVGHPAQMAYMALALNEPASKIHPKLVWVSGISLPR